MKASLLAKSAVATITPRELWAALDSLSRRRAAQVSRLSAITRLRGAA